MNTTSPEPESLKETLISIVIAFALAFVFRGFIAEAFVIPTGSMAPTLLGQHMRFHGSASGLSWAVGPWDSAHRSDGNYAAVQGNKDHPISVNDPMSGEYIEEPEVRLRAGDRILVLKYLYGVMSPNRYDVIVFHNPNIPQERYIKRLIGLPGEQVVLVDGDVFSRPTPPSFTPLSTHEAPETYAALWGDGLPDDGGWKIARKPDHVQRAVWQPVFDSEFTPVGATGSPSSPPDWFRRPWTSSTPGWSFSGATYTWTPSANTSSTTLTFDQSQRRFTDRRLAPYRQETWEINDRYPYDEVPDQYGTINTNRFPVSDLRVRAGLEVPEGSGTVPTATAVIEARGHVFATDFAAGQVTLRIRKPVGAGGVLSDWQTIATADAPGLLTPGEGVHNVEFWHSDQRLEVWVDDRKLIDDTATLDWSPAERVLYATGKSLVERLATSSPVPEGVLSQPAVYIPPKVRWEITGGALAMHRVGLDRDLFYQPRIGSSVVGPARAVDPRTTLTLSPDQFFACGDNSPASFDGRGWGTPHPWVETLIDPDAGVVPRDLLIGKAFFVYFPALLREGGPGPMIDFGRMRFIW